MITDENIKQLVLLRLETMPDGISVSIGSEGELTKEDLINAVKTDSTLGKQIVLMQLEYLKSMKLGFQNVI